MESNKDLSEYEILRSKNIEENRKMMEELGLLTVQNSSFRSRDSIPPEALRRSQSLKLRKSSGSVLISPYKRRSKRLGSSDSVESSFFSSNKRRSRRLASRNSIIVQFSGEVARSILGDENCCSVSMDGDSYNGDDDYDIDDFEIDVERKKQKKLPRRKNQNKGPREVPSVDDITEDDLKRVCEFVYQKVYSEEGTTCHQCRQKTLDQKTICRSEECIGIRGQFCGPCLKNRYGELVVKALKDPEWCCPPCRGMCNCSICRTQAGKVPTGQLFYLAQERGYKSVRHFLEKEVENDDD